MIFLSFQKITIGNFIGFHLIIRVLFWEILKKKYFSARGNLYVNLNIHVVMVNEFVCHYSKKKHFYPILGNFPGLGRTNLIGFSFFYICIPDFLFPWVFSKLFFIMYMQMSKILLSKLFPHAPFILETDIVWNEHINM